MLTLTLKDKYVNRAEAIIKILAKKGWEIIKLKNNDYQLINVTEEDKEEFIRYFTGEVTYSPIYNHSLQPNVKYFY